MSNICFLINDELFIMDKLSHIKLFHFSCSPYHRARMDFWEASEFLYGEWGEIVDFTPEGRLLASTTFWKHPPQLALPERAASLVGFGS